MTETRRVSFADLKKRLGIGTVLVLLLIFAIVFSQNFVVQFIIALVVLGVTLTCIWEYGRLLKRKECAFPLYLLSALAIIWVVANYLIILFPAYKLVLPVVAAGIFFTLFIYHFQRVENSIVDIATSFLGLFYILFPLTMMLNILYPASFFSHPQDGRFWIAYLLIVTKSTDVGAYFTGKLLGGVKLAPSVSPGKTVSGAIGGLIAAVGLSVVFFLIANVLPYGYFTLDFTQSLVLGGLMGLFAQLGDLTESLLKRDAQIKDSNKLPAFGGALDLTDSLLFTTPILFIYLLIL
ncbi:MAG: hypothetical protein S4CHLAM102_07380 [Chlamydiia bacterium]|nr:hypothetical protein [Chlamydiia bacterium]